MPWIRLYNINFDGKDNNGNVIPAGMYTSGIMVADSNGNQLSDLFYSNNDANHMLLIGLSAEMGSPMLAGGSNWNTVSDAPTGVGTGALGVDWDETGVATGNLAIDIVDQANSYIDNKNNTSGILLPLRIIAVI